MRSDLVQLCWLPFWYAFRRRCMCDEANLTALGVLLLGLFKALFLSIIAIRFRHHAESSSLILHAATAGISYISEFDRSQDRRWSGALDVTVTG